jgi:threonine aldolase
MERGLIDLRSDTVTRPSPAMRQAMAAAEVGDDIYGEDPTVNALQDRVAALLGKEAALYVPSGSMGNQISIKVHTRAGDEVIAEAGSHVFNYETAGGAFLSAVQIHPVEGRHGRMSLESIRRAVRPDIYYMPRTSLVCVENTHNRAGGTIYPLDLLRETSVLCRQMKLSVHLDGARLWNASVATGIPVREYAACADSVSVCFSKGLGAPVGSAIAGTKIFVEEARHYRKLFGGAMRQAGVLAAAAIYALDHNVERLTEDHEKASFLAREIGGLPGLAVDPETVQTNILIVNVEQTGRTPEEIVARLREGGLLVGLGPYGTFRAVTHLDVSMQDVHAAAAIVKRVLASL